MEKALKAAFGLFWVLATAFTVYLAYSVIMTERSPMMIWSWMVLCGFTFLSATVLAYNIIFGHHHVTQEKHHHKHLKK